MNTIKEITTSFIDDISLGTIFKRDGNYYILTKIEGKKYLVNLTSGVFWSTNGFGEYKHEFSIFKGTLEINC